LSLFEARVSVPWQTRIVEPAPEHLRGEARGGSSLDHGKEGWSVRTEFNYPLNRLFNKNVEIYFMVQRVDGYAESLIDFRKKTHVTRIGIALIR
jgi:hypothetical protein